MPHLKVQDVQDNLESLIKKLTEKFGDVENELEAIKSQISNLAQPTSCEAETPNVGGSLSEKVDKCCKKLEKLRTDTANHVVLYNNHIKQQHKHK